MSSSITDDHRTTPIASDWRSTVVGDAWGGVASSLVALPASIAFGVAVFGPIVGSGPGAIAGLLGATALGTLAPLVGGTPRLVSAPCAPAVAVLGTFGATMAARPGTDSGHVLVLLTLVALLAGVMQIALGLIRAGTVIKYIPYPVVAGYLSGVGVVVFLKQLPVLLGLPKGVTLGHGIVSPALWQWPALVVGAATIAAMALGPRLIKAVPAAILGLGGGVASYLALTLVRPDLRSLAGNSLVIGPLGGGSAGGIVDDLRIRFASLQQLSAADALAVVGPAATLAVVLSLDTLKTCVVVDAMTGGRHESNRELCGQGIANGVSAVIGGMPGAGTSGPTLVNIASGARTRWSGVIEGALVLFVFLFLGRVVAWGPLAALAGILVVVAFRMLDWGALGWVRRRSTALDFAVVLAVIATAVFVDLISASAAGVALSILLFIRNEARGEVIRRKLHGNEIFSKQRRLPEQLEVLRRFGGETVVVELAGSLFFGTTDQLRTRLETDLLERRTVILDFRRVDAIDLTAAHILTQMRGQLRKRGADMLFCNVPRSFAGHDDARAYLREVGLVSVDTEKDVVFTQLSDALAWAEDRLLGEHETAPRSELALQLGDLAMFQGRKPETIASLTACMKERNVAPGEYVFRCGDDGDAIFFVRCGTIKISLPLGDERLHVASIGRGDFLGEITFLDGGQRTADAIAETRASLYELSRADFEALSRAHPRLGQGLLRGLARALALRLRAADGEITALEGA